MNDKREEEERGRGQREGKERDKSYHWRGNDEKWKKIQRMRSNKMRENEEWREIITEREREVGGEGEGGRKEVEEEGEGSKERSTDRWLYPSGELMRRWSWQVAKGRERTFDLPTIEEEKEWEGGGERDNDGWSQFATEWGRDWSLYYSEEKKEYVKKRWEK